LNGTAGSVNDLSNITDSTAALTTSTPPFKRWLHSWNDRRHRQPPAKCRRVITNQVQNLTGAEDGVRAADIPSTVATLAKYSILEQTGISSLPRLTSNSNSY